MCNDDDVVEVEVDDENEDEDDHDYDDHALSAPAS